MGLVGNPYYQAAAQVLTFLVVVFTLVLFRADSLATASYLYQQILSFNGFEFTPAFLSQLTQSGIFRLEAILFDSLSATGTVYGLLALALACCWLLPSTYQLFQRFQVAIDKPIAGRAPIIAMEWQTNWRWAVLIAALALLSGLNLNSVSEFLYFQF